MSEVPESPTGPSATQRAEVLLNHLAQRFREAREKASAGQHEPAPSNEGGTVARADEMLDRMGQQVGYFVSVAGQRIRKATALAREEAEDIWAEVQSNRQREDQEQNTRKPDQQ